MAKLNAKQQRFVAEYLVDLNATQAAIRAGYSEKTAKQIGSRLLTNVDIAAAAAEAKEKQAERLGITADRVLQELAVVGFSDVWNYEADENGVLSLAENAPKEASRAVASVKHKSRTVNGKDDYSETTHEVEYRLWDKNAALTNLGRHFKMFTDVTQHEGLDALADAMKAAEKRVAKRG